MKHFLIIISALTVLLPSCGNEEESKKHVSLMEASRQELVDALEERDQLLLMVNEISEMMEQIKKLENILNSKDTSALENPDRRKQLLSDMLNVKKAIEFRRARLAQLEKRIQDSSIANEDLEATIRSLRKLMDTEAFKLEQINSCLSKANEKIDYLNFEVDSLNSTVAAVSHNLDSVQAASSRMEKELNNCYYVVADKKMLKAHRIIGTSFLRKTKLLEGDFDKDFFISADKRKLNKIEFKSGRIKIYTNHPVDSYEISELNHNKTLIITDPDKFWSITNYLVVQAD